MQTAAIALPPVYLTRLRDMAVSEKISLEEALQRALDSYFQLMEINRLRQKFSGKAEAAGFHSEEEIYEAIS